MTARPITERELYERGVATDFVTKALLPLSSLDTASLDSMIQAFSLPHGRNLLIRIGKGITYRATLESGHGDLVEVRASCQDDAFVYPMSITLEIALPLKQGEHEKGCRFNAGAQQFSDVDCDCPYQNYDNQVYIVNSDQELDVAIARVQLATSGYRNWQKVR